MTNRKFSIGFIGNKDYTDILLNFIKKEFHEFEPSIEFLGSNVKCDNYFSKKECAVYFLDADLPDLDLQKINEIKRDPFPVFILISSSKSKAVNAFEINALDFLLRPLQEERIKKSLNILKEKLFAFRVYEGLNHIDNVKLPSMHTNGNGHLNRILIRVGKKMVFVNVDSIIWIESESNYNRLHTSNDNYLNRGSLKHLLKKLDPNKFFRINRSVIVNIDKIKQIEPFFHGDYKVIMGDDTELKITRNYSDFLSDFKCTI